MQSGSDRIILATEPCRKVRKRPLLVKADMLPTREIIVPPVLGGRRTCKGQCRENQRSATMLPEVFLDEGKRIREMFHHLESE
jgi:hypothetical protein